MIVFDSFTDTPGFHAMRPDGSALRRLAYSDEALGNLRFSPDGRFLAWTMTSYARDKTWGEDLVFVSGVDAADARRVRVPEGGAHSPQLSPGGKRLALVYTNDPFNGPWDVWSASTDGEDFEQLSSTGGVESLAWSPDGEQIAFMDRPVVDEEGWLDETGDIYVMRADGTETRRVARGSDPIWSPDGKLIAFADPEGRIVAVDPSGGAPKIVSPDGRHPVWSPDGKSLAFLRITTCGHATCSEAVFVVEAKGGTAQRVGPTLFEPTLLAWTTVDLPAERPTPERSTTKAGASG